MNKYKNLNYRQLRKKFRINPLADDDRDKVLNYKDCRPWDKRKQDYDPEEQERHLDNIRRLQQQNLQLKDELEESSNEVNEKLKEWESTFKEGKTEGESFGEWRNYIQSLHKQNTLQEDIKNKLNAIEEEKEFLE